MPSFPVTTTRHVEPLVAFAKGAHFLAAQIEAAKKGEAGACEALRELMPRAVLAAWDEAFIYRLVHSSKAGSDYVCDAAERNADAVVAWFLNPSSVPL